MNTPDVQAFDADDLDHLLRRLAAGSVITLDGCWVSMTSSAEYPHVLVAGEYVKLHRFIFVLCGGVLLPGETVDHTCHNRARAWCTEPSACWHRRCWNPAHLRAATHAENQAAAGPRVPRLALRDADPRAWIATREAAIRLGRVSADAPADDITRAAHALGRELAARYGIRATLPRRTGDGGRARGYFLDELRDALGEAAAPLTACS